MDTKQSYKSQVAKDAQQANYGAKAYWDYLEENAHEKAKYYAELGMTEMAEKMLTRSLTEALQGNDGR